MPQQNDRPKVYRLRNLPLHVDRFLAVELLASCLEAVVPADIYIFSLAKTVDQWENPPTKVATLMFRNTPVIIASRNYDQEWSINIPGFLKPLILDTSFSGMTILNEVMSPLHNYDCIILSGLSSHPLGSWQPKGADKSFMWIRDVLPERIPFTRFIIYGYDTTIVQSNSFQTVLDLAGSFIQELKANGWGSPTSKPIFFLAHSLGGILLKQVLVMLAGSGTRETFLLGKIRGAIFFGVPSVGMPISHLRAMVEDQPNKTLVEDLSDQSDYISKLEDQFSGISYIRRMKLFWAYETETSRTVVKDPNGVFSRSGPRSVMVTRESATRSRCYSDPASTIQINRDHSNMVKFTRGDELIPKIANKIREILDLEVDSQQKAHYIYQTPTASESGESDRSAIYETESPTPAATEVSVAEEVHWNLASITRSLRAPERDSRLEQIEHKLGHTFDWVYEEDTVGFTSWLRNGKGIYWVSGKPGSGKSTLMKFVYGDRRTSELLLHNWSSKSRQVSADFFFHHRGSSVQKSFEGLLRSVLSQIMEKEPSLRTLLSNVLDNVYRERIKIRRLGNLESDLINLLKTCGIHYISPITQKEKTRLTRIPDAREELLLVLSSYIDPKSPEAREIEEEILSHKDDLLQRQPQNLNTLVSHFQDTRFPDIPAAIDLQDIIKRWREKMSMELRVRNFLQQRSVLGIAHSLQSIRELVERYFARRDLQREIQTAEWTRSALEEALQGLLHQDIFDLDLCLFFDALDEYDGRSDFISAFLKDLVREVPSSRTKVRVLFSSRPHPAFRKAFQAGPGFEIHKHTENDIHSYCIGSICSSPAPDDLLLPMLGEITRRARGVFLWVKLVLKDLATLACSSEYNVSDLRVKLQQSLDSIPDQLDDYYSTIIDRIPQVSRWGTYVVLECVSRTDSNMSLQSLYRALECSTHSTFEDGRLTLILTDFAWQREQLSREAENRIRTLSGGLVDVIHPAEGDSYVQFMHQTCKDWVEDLRFKQIVLGERSKVTWQNGHSLLAKYHFLEGTIPDPFVHHARLAEETSGISQYSFLSQAPEGYILSQPLLHPHIKSVLGLAICYGLSLCLNDAILEKEFVNHVSEPLFSLIDRAFEAKFYTTAEATIMSQTLAKNGFDIEKDLKGLEGFITRMWGYGIHSSSMVDPPAEELVVLTRTALECLHDFELPISWNGESVRVLHISTPGLAEWLLAKGADANSVSANGETPLDFALQTRSPQAKSGVGYQYEYCKILFNHGGVLRSTSRDTWGKMLRKFSSKGLDVSGFPESDSTVTIEASSSSRTSKRSDTRPSSSARHDTKKNNSRSRRKRT